MLSIAFAFTTCISREQSKPQLYIFTYNFKKRKKYIYYICVYYILYVKYFFSKKMLSILIKVLRIGSIFFTVLINNLKKLKKYTFSLDCQLIFMIYSN